ncbi:protein ABHD1 [Rhipicephalus sanguineus]|nr:protein ABHD1 [Rhipicephalus sanguineus]
MLSTLQLVCLVAFAMYLLYYYTCVARKPWVICGSANMRTFLRVNCGSLVEEPFWPPIWCIGSNFQCLVSLIVQNFLPLLPLRRQMLTLSDGGTVALDWINEEYPPPVVLFLTGLSSGSQVYYMRSLVPLVAQLRCPCVVLNNRGQNGLHLNNFRLVSALSTGDLAEVVAAVRRRFPGSVVVAVGYSMGGMLLSHYLLQTGDASQIDAGLSVSAPFYLPTSYDNLMSWSSNFLINLYLTNCLMTLIRRNVHVMGATDLIDVNQLQRCRTLYDFDNRYTAPVFGFRNAMDFYEYASLNGKLSTVRRPLLYLLAADDAFGSLETLPVAEIERSPWLSAVVTPRGGHLGFVDGWLWPKMPFYGERFAAAYVRGLLALARGPLGPKALHSLVHRSTDSLSPYQPAVEKLTASYTMSRPEDREVATAEKPSRENKRNQDIIRAMVTTHTPPGAVKHSTAAPARTGHGACAAAY